MKLVKAMNCSMIIFSQHKVNGTKFNSEPFENKSESIYMRYYQEIAVNRIMNVVAKIKIVFINFRHRQGLL
jgi:hypothetical protein